MSCCPWALSLPLQTDQNGPHVVSSVDIVLSFCALDVWRFEWKWESLAWPAPASRPSSPC